MNLSLEFNWWKNIYTRDLNQHDHWTCLRDDPEAFVRNFILFVEYLILSCKLSSIVDLIYLNIFHEL